MSEPYGRLSVTLSAPHIRDVHARAVWLEESGFHTAWVGEGRMRRDAVSTMTLALAATSRLNVASGIIPARTRNATLIAMTWKSLYQFAPGRVVLGLGSWWEPIAGKAGLSTSRPLLAMRETVEAVRGMLAGETVTIDGEYVRLNGIRFDGTEDELPGAQSYDVPIVCAAVGPRMLDLAAEIGDGVLLDFFMDPSYTRRAIARVSSTDLKPFRGRRVAQLIACCINDRDPRAAEDELRVILTRYLAQQPHIGEHSGVDPDLVARLRGNVTWPARNADIVALSAIVPRRFVRQLCAAGTTTQVLDKIGEYTQAGLEEVVLAPFGSGIEGTLTKVSKEWTSI